MVVGLRAALWRGLRAAWLGCLSADGDFALEPPALCGKLLRLAVLNWTVRLAGLAGRRAAAAALDDGAEEWPALVGLAPVAGAVRAAIPKGLPACTAGAEPADPLIAQAKAVQRTSGRGPR